MTWIESYVDEGTQLLESSDIEEIKRFIARIQAVKDLVTPVYGFNCHKKAFADEEPDIQLCLIKEDVKIIIEALKIKIEKADTDFAQRYGTATLDDHIQRCRAILMQTDGAESAESFCKHVACVYTRKIPNLKESLSVFSAEDEKDFREDVAKLLEFLLVYRDDIVKSHQAPSPKIDSNDLLYALVKDKLSI